MPTSNLMRLEAMRSSSDGASTSATQKIAVNRQRDNDITEAVSQSMTKSRSLIGAMLSSSIQIAISAFRASAGRERNHAPSTE